MLSTNDLKTIQKEKHARKIYAPTKAKRGLSEREVQKLQKTAAGFFFVAK